MRATRSFQALGFAFCFESDDASLVDTVDRCYRDMPPATEPVSTLRAAWREESDSFHVTVVDPVGNEQVCEDVTPDGVLDVLTWEVNDRATASWTPAPILHATVTCGPLGAIALCGASHSGKSTLAGGAAARGWGHLSDDLAPIDLATMTVHPYARPIMLRDGGLDHLASAVRGSVDRSAFLVENWFVPASELGAATVVEPQPLVAAAFLEWGDQARLIPLSRAQTLYRLSQNSVTLDVLGFSDLERIATSVPGLRLVLGDVETVLDLVAGVIGVA